MSEIKDTSVESCSAVQCKLEVSKMKSDAIKVKNSFRKNIKDMDFENAKEKEQMVELANEAIRKIETYLTKLNSIEFEDC